MKDKVVSYASLITTKFPEIVWLVDKIIPDECLTMISGSPASFKTWLMLDLAICITSGKKFLNQFDVKKDKILFVDEESGERIIQRRLLQLTKESVLDIKFLCYKDFKLSASDEIISYCLENNIGVVIIDSLIRVHSGEENSSKEMSKLYDELKKYKKNNISVIIAHHNKKTGNNQHNPSEDVRGSSEIVASVDAGISIRSLKEKKQLKITPHKCRIAEEHKPFTIDISDTDGFVSFNYSGEIESIKESKIQTAKDSIINLLSGGQEMYQKEIIESLKNTVGESSVKESLKELLSNKTISLRKGDGNIQYYKLNESGESCIS